MTDMSKNIAELKNELSTMIEAANDLDSLEQARVTALGKKGRITDLMKTLGQMSDEERKTTGQALNALKDEIAGLIGKQEAALKKQAIDERLETEWMDVTLNPRFERKGQIHPISRTMEEQI